MIHDCHINLVILAIIYIKGTRTFEEVYFDSQCRYVLVVWNLSRCLRSHIFRQIR